MKIEKYIKLLGSLVEIPSVSSMEEHSKDVVESANIVRKLFEDLGLANRRCP